LTLQTAVFPQFSGFTMTTSPTTRDISVRVWDLPTRLFHWALVVLITAMAVTGWTGRLDLHMLLGQAVLALVLFRLVWGFTGNRYARFRSFVAGPAAAMRYLGGLFSPAGERHIGHNPVGGYAVLAMLALILLQAGTGLFTSDDIVVDGPLYHLVPGRTGSLLSTVHRLGIWALVAVIAVHLLANAFYLLVKKDNLVLPMVTGRKPAPAGADAGPGGSALLAAAILLACLAIVYGGIALMK
jgi:cytochrome b